MKVKLFQVWDREAQAVTGPIMTFEREGPAIREFHTAMATEGTYLNRNPGDYDLIQIGEQETTTGVIDPIIKNGISVHEVVTEGWKWKQANEKIQSIPENQFTQARQLISQNGNT